MIDNNTEPITNPINEAKTRVLNSLFKTIALKRNTCFFNHLKGPFLLPL